MVLNAEYGSGPPARNAHEAAEHTQVIPGTPERAARDVQAVSPEGRPGDPKSGPARIRSEMLVAALIVVVAVAASAIWVGWIAGVAALVIGGLALVFNPVMAAAGERAKDRVEVLDRRDAGGSTPEGTNRV